MLKRYWAMAVTIALFGCTWFAPATSNDLTAKPAPPTGVSTAATLPNPTAPPTANIQPTPDDSCVPPAEPQAPVSASSLLDLSLSIAHFINEGGTANALEQALRTAGAVTEASGSVTEVDLTGDGAPEIVAAVNDPAGNGQLLIFTCNGGQFVNAYQSGDETASFGVVPAVIAAQDVTQDGRADLIFTLATCGAHTCTGTLFVVGWDGTEFVDWVSGDSSLASATVVVRPGLSSVAIEMRGGIIGSVGAGPQRAQTNIWQWNGSAVALANTSLDAATYRFHLLNDADDAAKRGDVTAAMAMYERVVNDESLLTWEAVADERAYLSAYALFKLALINLQRGELGGAQNWRDRLLVDFPPDAPGGAFSHASDLFWQRYEQDGDMSAACREVIAYFESNALALGEFNRYGYANRDTTPADVCPY